MSKAGIAVYLVLQLAVFLTWGGCSSDEAGCRHDTDCPDRQICAAGTCIEPGPDGMDGGADDGNDGGDPAAGDDGSAEEPDGAPDGSSTDDEEPTDDAGDDANGDDGAPSCPSGVLCGSPAVCCEQLQECYQGQCVAICPSGVRCAADGLTCCEQGSVCLAHECVQPGESCLDSFDCPEGFFCEPSMNACLPQITGLLCEVRPGFADFTPLVEWHWAGYSANTAQHNVAVTPAVADLDADGTPEVVFGTYAKGADATVRLMVLSGADGSEELTVETGVLNLATWSGVALGDLDSDPELEIVLLSKNLGVVALEHDGSVKWSEAGGSLGSILSNNRHGYPALANLDADPFPEVVVGGVALDEDGEVLFDHGWIGCNSSWCMSAVADLDSDGAPDLVGGNRAYRATGELLWQQAAVGDGFPAVADLDSDGRPEVVTVTSGEVYVLEGEDGAVAFGPVSVPGGGNGGAPTVADFDGDGRREFATAGEGYYTVYDLDCTPQGDPTGCGSDRSDGILWQVVTQDISSSITGSSVFDFEGDGNAEVVYNDECHLYVFSGRDGSTLLSLPNSSRTAAEYPLVVDVDGDNNSEFLVPANNDQIDRDHCDPPGQQGIYAFGDAADRWMRTRRVWNQHTYHVTNVQPGGVIPATELDNWGVPGLNNFRQNVQGEGVFNAPDLLVIGVEVNPGSACAFLDIRATIANQGSLGAPAGVPVSFYLGTPFTGTFLGMVPTSGALLPGASEALIWRYPIPPAEQGPWDFYVVADDDGNGGGTQRECIEDNNTGVISAVPCYQ